MDASFVRMVESRCARVHSVSGIQVPEPDADDDVARLESLSVTELPDDTDPALLFRLRKLEYPPYPGTSHTFPKNGGVAFLRMSQDRRQSNTGTTKEPPPPVQRGSAAMATVARDASDSGAIHTKTQG
jgi:hypothetical protein